jgi:hypothetical protein
MTRAASEPDATVDLVTGRLADLRGRIERAAPDPPGVTVVAVTKGFGPATAAAALAAGIADLGENYAAELLDKAGALVPGCGLQPTWHFLGAVQRNKVARLAPVVSCWQSVCRPEEGAAIARHRPGAAVLVQVEIAGRPERRGRPPEEVTELVRVLGQEDVVVRGLMAVGVPGPPEASRAGFRRVVELAEELGLPVRSIGMSDDLEVALAEGSTMVRVGRALFGERPSNRADQGPEG